MMKCPKCGGEIRYIVGSSSSGNPGQPITVDIKPKTLISESGRRIMGYREHECGINPNTGNK